MWEFTIPVLSLLIPQTAQSKEGDSMVLMEEETGFKSLNNMFKLQNLRTELLLCLSGSEVSVSWLGFATTVTHQNQLMEGFVLLPVLLYPVLVAWVKIVVAEAYSK